MARPRTGSFVLTLVMLVFLSPEAGAEDRRLPPADTYQLEEIGREQPDLEVVVAGQELWAILEHDAGADGFRGRYIVEWEAWLRTRAAVNAFSRVTVSSSDIRKLDEVRVEVRSLDGRRHKTFDRGDLEWVDSSRSSAGIVSLDTEHQQAAVPSLRVGDVIYVRQILEVKGLHGLPVVTFGDADVPVLHDSYTLSLPKDHELQSSLLGDEGICAELQHSVVEKGARRLTTWRLEQPDGHAGEEVRVTPQVVTVAGRPLDDSFTVGDSWSAVGASYRRRIAPSLAPDEKITATALAVTASCATDSQRIAALYDHLQGTTRYLGFYEGLDGIMPETSASVHERGYGDCKGLAAYLVALLTAVDIEAHPVLVRTASLGSLDPALPNMTQFNHMIAWADVGPGGMWLDATVDHCPAGMIVPQDTASDVLLLRSGHEGLQTIPTETWRPGTLKYTVDGRLADGFQLECTITLETTGLAASWQRGVSEQGGGDLSRAVERLLMPRSIGTRVIEHAADEGADGPRWNCVVRSEAPLPHTAEAIYLPAILPPMPRLQSVDDVAKEEDRHEEWSLVLPAGWSVAEDDQVFDAGAVTWHRRIWQEGDRLRLVREITWQPAGQDTVDMKAAMREIVGRDSGFINISTGEGR